MTVEPPQVESRARVEAWQELRARAARPAAVVTERAAYAVPRPSARAATAERQTAGQGRVARGPVASEERAVMSACPRAARVGRRRPAGHLSGRRDRRKALWTLFVFERWLARWGNVR